MYVAETKILIQLILCKREGEKNKLIISITKYICWNGQSVGGDLLVDKLCRK